MPTVSVIMPIYNTEKYLKKAIESILAQTYIDFELILVDDGSPDNAGDLCDIYATKDERIKVIHKENGCLTSARKAGFLAANGEYISFVDSDDYVHCDFLLKLVRAIQKYQAEIAMCSYMLVTKGEERVASLPWKENVLYKDDILQRYALPLIGRIHDRRHMNVPGFMWLRLFKKSCLKEEYFVSEREVFTEDDIFDLYHSEQINALAIVNEPLYYYIQHAESLTNRYRKDTWAMLINRYVYCQKWLEANGLLQIGEERLKAALLVAVCASVDNAVQKKKYRFFKQEIKEIRKSKLFQEMFLSVNINIMAKSQKLTYYLLKYRCTFLLYLYRKGRQK